MKKSSGFWRSPTRQPAKMVCYGLTITVSLYRAYGSDNAVGYQYYDGLTGLQRSPDLDRLAQRGAHLLTVLDHLCLAPAGARDLPQSADP